MCVCLYVFVGVGLGSVLSSLGKELSQEEVENMISEVDADGNGSLFYHFYNKWQACHIGLFLWLSGTIEFPEFVDMMMVNMSSNPEEEILEAFKVFWFWNWSACHLINITYQLVTLST